MKIVRVKVVSRAKAQKIIASTKDPEVIRPLLSHANKHIKAYATHKLVALEAAALLRAKRSEASRKAAATRKAKKAAEAA